MSRVRNVSLSQLDDAQVDQLLDRREALGADVLVAAQKIIDDVRQRGDAALIDYARKFDGADLSRDGLRVSESQIEAAADGVAPQLRNALDAAIAGIKAFHQGQRPTGDRWVEVRPGVWCGERFDPIDTVCLYVPRGRGSFSSVACMLAVPAMIAKVNRPIVCTPPGPDGQVDPATLYVCHQTGVREVYRVGGAQAVSAVAYGTETVPRCVKFVGPGNVYVSAARRLLADVIDPGPPAGPSESLIVADANANANNAAWNLLIESEHGENSTAFLVTDSRQLARGVSQVIGTMIDQLEPRRRKFAETVLSKRGGIVLADSMEQCIDFANRMAPEHLALMVVDPWSVHPRIQGAGEILFGDYPIISLGNYAMGVNAILPTGGRAAGASSVSVMDFMTRTELGFVTGDGFESIKDHVSVLSRDEGFSAHHLSVENWNAPDNAKEFQS